jgi:hypothetical protein
MKLMKKRPEERVTALKTHRQGEERFRYAAREEISETSCRDAKRWTEGDRPADADVPDVAVAS